MIASDSSSPPAALRADVAIPAPGTCGTTAAAWPVMVLAHNEERHIEACLDSIFEATDNHALDVFVMANGCTDTTEQQVAKYARRQPQVHLVSIELGDKCNAWNVFIHDTVTHRCAGRDIYFFMDGDARATRGSFDVMALALASSPYAHAASAVPVSGRNAARDRRDIVAGHGLVANLYALRGSFVDRLRIQGVRIPLKLEGDDGLIGALIKWDLDPQHNGFDNARIQPCADAGFAFQPVSVLRPADWKMYWKRAVRYGRRRYEFSLLAGPLKRVGLNAMPRDITDLYGDSRHLQLRWDGFYTIPNWIALQAMRKNAGKSTRT